MTHTVRERTGKRIAAALISLAVTASPALGKTVAQKKAQALTQYINAEQKRQDLEDQPAAQRTQRDYQRVIDAYRRAYYLAPGFNRADASVMAVGDLLAEQGRTLHDKKSLQDAVGQYEFLRRQYPGSKYRFQALFNIGKIYQDDLSNSEKATSAFQEFLRRYPHDELAPEARAALSEPPETVARPSREAKGRETKLQPPAEQAQETTPAEDSAEPRAGRPVVSTILHWSTPEGSRVVIELGSQVKFESARVAHPNRIYFDLHNTRLSGSLLGKSFEVENDPLLKKIRVAQFKPGETRVVLEVSEGAQYSASMLRDPSRLMVEIRGDGPRQELAKAAPVPESKVVDDEPPGKAGISNERAGQAAARGEQSPAPEPSAAADQPGPGPEKVRRAAEVTRKPEAPAASRASSNKTAAVKRTAKPALASLPSPASEDANAAGAAGREAISMRKAPPEAQPDAAPIAAVAKLEVPAETAPQVPAAGISPTASAAPAKNRVTRVVVPADEDEDAAPEKPARRSLSRIKPPAPTGREAQPTSSGERSLVRALGLKIGRIVVDAGHGGHDTGTIGPNGLLEKDLVLDVSLRLGKLLEKRLGAEVTYTRDDDTFVPLESRTAIANQNQADLFISVHANSSRDSSARGVETYYLNFTSSADALEVAARENATSDQSVHELQDLVKKIALKDKIEESREFAADVQQALYTGLSGRSAGLRNRGVKKAPFIVLIGANMPSILAEISFVSNPADARRLQTAEYRQKIAESLYHGIAKYAAGLSGVRVAASSPKHEAE